MAVIRTTAPPDGFAPPRRGVTAIEVEEALGPPQQAEEIASALGVPVQVGAVSVPVPGLVALSLLEQIESPFIARTDAELATVDTLRALYICREPRKAAVTVADALRAGAALDRVAERAAGNPALWEAYLDAVSLGARAGWRAFDAAVTAFGETLGAADPIDLANAVAHQVALASRGYEMIPPGDDSPKPDAASVSSGSAPTPSLSTGLPG